MSERVLTPKAERTRERIFAAALSLFSEKGYERATMRDVAKAAGASLGLAYRYFASKEELVLELYLRLADGFGERVREELPTGTVAERFEEAMFIKLELAGPYREPLGALTASALNPNSGIAVLGPGTARIRKRVDEVFLEVVNGASDAPRGERQRREMAAVLNAAHLGVLLYWFHDRSEGNRATREAVAFARDAIRLVRPALRLPPPARAFTRLAGVLVAMGIGGAAPRPPAMSGEGKRAEGGEGSSGLSQGPAR